MSFLVGKCAECREDVLIHNNYYCKPCNSAHWQDNFQKWTSGDSTIDQLIQESQINATDPRETIEWIEYSNLENFEHVADGGFSSVYKAIWKDGPIEYDYDSYDDDSVNYRYWDIGNSNWIRKSDTLVAVKKLRNATRVTPEFLNEVKNIIFVSKYTNISNLINDI